MAGIHQRLYTHPISKFEVPHIGSNLDNYTSTLVARGSHTVMRHWGETNIPLHEMNVRCAESREIQTDQNLVRAYTGLGVAMAS